MPEKTPELVALPGEKEGPRPGRILIVDDFDFDRQEFASHLDQRGHTIFEAESGEQALQIVEKEELDLILLDSRLPGMTGLEVLQAIRRTQTPLDLPIIMVTGVEDPAAMVEGFRAGANDYVTKPPDQAVLAARVGTQLRALRYREAYVRAQDFNESLIESTQDAIFALDMQWRLTVFNRAAEQLLSYQRTELLGRPASMLFQDSDAAFQIITDTLEHGSRTLETRLRGRTQECCNVQLSCSVQVDKKGNPIGLIVIAKDLTELKRLQSERAQLFRTREEFLAIASHDLKSPLTAIAGYASLLEMIYKPGSTIDERGYEALADMNDAIRRMQRIVTDFVDFHALQQAHLFVAKEPSDLAEIVKGVVAEYKKAAKDKGITLRMEVPGDLPWVPCDPDRIQQVLANLISNAIKYCRDGDHACCSVEVTDGHAIVLISDTGPGLPQQDLEIVFQKFARLSNKPTGGEKSHGFGLSICKQLVELHGGKVGVKNNEGGGATFWFTLPVER